jgi:hypothetical protein
MYRQTSGKVIGCLVGFEVLTAVSTKMAVFFPDDGGSKDL